MRIARALEKKKSLCSTETAERTSNTKGVKAQKVDNKLPRNLIGLDETPNKTNTQQKHQQNTKKNNKPKKNKIRQGPAATWVVGDSWGQERIHLVQKSV